MFRLIAGVKRGSTSTLPETWPAYPTLEAARTGAKALMRNERVTRVMVVRDDVPPAFVEWGA